MLSRLNRTVAALDTVSPFLGGKALERRRGRPFRARLGANECLFGVSPRVQQAWQALLADAGHYNDPTHHELREAVSGAWGVGMEHIAVGEGIDCLLELLVRAFVEPGDAVVTSLGAYPTFDYHARGFGARILRQPYLPHGANDLQGLLRLARESGAKLLYLANPDNPTGSFFAAEAMQDLVDRLPQGCLLLLDEAYAEFAPAAQCLPGALVRPNLARLRTFSKAYGLAGARVGYMVGPPGLVNVLDRIRQHFGVSKQSQEIALAAFGDGDYLRQVVEATHAANRHYLAMAAAAGIRALPTSANFVAFEFGDAAEAAFVERWLDRHDVFVRRPPVAPLDRLVRVTAAPAPLREYFGQVLAAGVQAWRRGERDPLRPPP